MMRYSTLAVLAGMIFLMAAPATALEPGDGYVKTPNGKIWYRVVGSGDATPLLLLHGGPGVPSSYMDGMVQLAGQRPVIFYDQLGCGRSDHITDTSLWTIDYYVTEIDTIRQALGLDEIHLYGHSWGTILGVEYMLRHPTGVRSLVLGSPALSIPFWERDADSLVATLPDTLQAAIAKHVAAGTFDSPEYQGAVMEFYGRYLARKQPWSASLDNAFAMFNHDIYGYMWGPSEFTATGTLKGYDCTGRLGQLDLPILITTGEFDEAPPATAAAYQRLIPGARLAVIEGSAHLTMHDNPARNAQVIREFLRTVEER